MKKKNDCWNLSRKKYIADWKTGGTSRQSECLFLLQEGENMALDLQNIGKAIYESIFHRKNFLILFKNFFPKKLDLVGQFSL